MYPSPFKSIPSVRSRRLTERPIPKEKQNMNRLKEIYRLLTHFLLFIYLLENIERVNINCNIFALVQTSFL